MPNEEPPNAAQDPPSRFPPTRWTLIRRIGEGEAPDRENALAEVCRLYWPPVYAYIRSCGKDSHDAEDLTQGFFAQLLGRDAFAKLQSGNGKLRSYLLQSVRNYLDGDNRRDRRLKRGGATPTFVLDPGKLESLASWMGAPQEEGPDRAFDRLWAATVLETAYDRLAIQYHERGQTTLFESLSPAIRADGGEIDYSAAANRLGTTEPTLRVAMHRLRRRYGDALRMTVAETLDPGDDPAEELRQLMAAFA